MQPSALKPLTVLACYDGRPGHEKQTLGIVNALAAITPVEIEEIILAASSATYLSNLAAYFLPFFKINNFEAAARCRAELIIGTGTHTHIPMLLYRRQQKKVSGRQARVVTCMTPEKLLMHEFDLCCIPWHDEPAAGDNVFVTQGPPNSVQQGSLQQNDRGLILVGGIDPKSHVWKSGETIEQIRTIIDSSPEMNWTVSSSPRTPEETCLDLAKTCTARQNVTFFRSADTPAGWIEEQYAANRTVWVTADSVSMVYEALTAGCSVGVLPVDWLHRDDKFQKSLRYLLDRGMIVEFHTWRNGAALPVLKDSPLDESGRCAEEILRRWWPDRLP